MTRCPRAVAIAALLAAVGWASGAAAGDEETPAGPAALAGGDFSLHTLDGAEVRFSAYRGRVRVVNLWASWCYPCRFEMPLLQRVHDRFADRGLTVLAIAVDDEIENVRRYQAKYAFTFPILFDATGAAKRAFQSDSVPQTFVLDRGERLVAFEHPTTREISTRIEDPLVWQGPEIMELLEELVGQ